MLKYQTQITLALFFLIATAEASAETSVENAPAETEPTLWRGLVVGMSPEDVIPHVERINGVRRAKVTNERNAEKATRVKITHEGRQIRIGRMAFQLSLKFSNARLGQVVLTSGDRCGETAPADFEILSRAIGAKHPEVLYEAPMRRSDILRAYSKSVESGTKQTVTHFYANEEVTVLLSFAFARQPPPSSPGYGSKLARMAYQLARNGYVKRRSECNGTGDRRVDVIIQYMSRSEFDKRKEAIERRIGAEQKNLADQL